MFENRCIIRETFLSQLKKNISDINFDKNDFICNKNLPKKEGIFQHLPLFNLYKEKFLLLDKKILVNEKIEETKIDLDNFINENILIFYNGFYIEEFSEIIEDGIEINIEGGKVVDTSIKKEEYNFFAQYVNLYKTLDHSGRNLSININRSLKYPLNIINLSNDVSSIDNYFLPNILAIEVKKDVQAKVIYSNQINSKRKFWQNFYVDLILNEKANVCLHISSEGEEERKSFSFNQYRIALKKDALLNIDFSSFGNFLEHSDFNIDLDGKGACVNILGILLLKKEFNAHLNININHLKKDTFSNELIKSILKDSSISSFESTVFIDKLAKYSNAHQLSKNMILSSKAKAFSKPFLKVDCDDVKATHGSLIDKINDDELFFLLSRGLREAMAKAFLLKGFCQEIVNRLNIKKMRDKLYKQILTYLNQDE